MTEQEIIDVMMLDREPCYQRHDATEPDSCGHYNCQYHGICFYLELLYVFGDHEHIEEHIRTHPQVRTREEFCFRCGHRCQSVKYSGHHTISKLWMGKLQHEQCICRGFMIDTAKWYKCHDENEYQSQHEGLWSVWEGSSRIPHENGLEGNQLRTLRQRSQCETSERRTDRCQVSQSISTR